LKKRNEEEVIYLKNKTTGIIAKFNKIQQGWRELTATELAEEELKKARKLKIENELFPERQIFLAAGITYEGHQFRLIEQVLSNLTRKKCMSASNPHRFVFFDDKNQEVNFGNQASWQNFEEAIVDEQDRVMRKYNEYKEQIENMTDIEAIKNLVITFEEN